METYENEQRNQMGTENSSNQQLDPRTQRQQASYDNEDMMSPKNGNMNEDDDEMDDDRMIDDGDDDSDVEELEEDNQGTGGGIKRESDMNRGTMSAS